MKVFVAGHAGLVGSAVVREIVRQGEHQWVGRTSSELDLRRADEVDTFLAQENPDAVIIAAARVGGIGANDSMPVQFLSDNLQIEISLINACHRHDIDKVLFLGSSCIYPKLSPQPILEEYLLTGPLEPTNEAYAISKIAGIKLIQAYRRQYSRNWVSVMPTNLYGPNDNFDLETSHVLPALLAKFHRAKMLNEAEVQLWGTGNARREFLHVDDLARACLFLLTSYDDSIPINVGTGTDISIRELSDLVKSIVGYTGEVAWDRTKPDGTPRKLLNTDRIRKLGWTPAISLESGIRDTYNWYKSMYTV